jgi:5,6-dimethylbenzimidazole synthase
MDTDYAFSDLERAAIYKCIALRRDVRSEFLSDPIPQPVLARMLHAAHQAPSVGLSQPWNFIVVRDIEKRRKIHDAFLDANREAAALFDPTRSENYRALKLEGILEAPIGLCVTCDRERGGKVVLGKTHQPEMDLFSTVCAIQNLWLAARAEGIGVGWMSIIDPQRLKSLLSIPDAIVPIAYLCVGYVSGFYPSPELEHRNWAKRNALNTMVRIDHWENESYLDGLFAFL